MLNFLWRFEVEALLVDLMISIAFRTIGSSSNPITFTQYVIFTCGLYLLPDLFNYLWWSVDLKIVNNSIDFLITDKCSLRTGKSRASGWNK